ncbi:MAG TPA: DUF4838 domain-containing protein [Candidatus Hydrogenedentes bacterium]|nr:DUF4838 domain-containing protein [Candidatus Hydrogenedentota bacterium]
MTSLHALTLSEQGVAKVVIVTGVSPAPDEVMASKELLEYCKKITGADFRVVAEGAQEGVASVFVGDTEFARAHGILVAEMAAEQWVIRTVDGGVVLAGGRPRGTLYAVYRFLEEVLGVRWWNAYEESVPFRPDLAIDSLELKGAPGFRYRDIYMLYAGDGGRFAARNRLNRDGDAGISPAYGGEMGYGPPYHVHTFNMYIPPEQYFDEHPEWFSLVNGKRDAKRKQLCLSNGELRGVFLEKLKEYIRTSREKAAKAGTPAPQVFDVSQNDWGGMCQCEACQAIAKTEESEAGPLLDFVNYLADGIRGEYPDVWIDTLAYMMTQKPPKTIRPRDHVIIRLCDTGSNFTKPITDLENTAFRECVERWAKVAQNLRIWDYAVTYAPYYGLPLPTVQTYQPDYVFFQQHQVEGVFTELEYPILADMRDYKVWMMMKLLEDPGRDYAALRKTFLNGFYGKSGAFIEQYLNRLEGASEQKPSYLSMGASPSQYRYLDLGLVLGAQDLFDQAETAAEGDAVLLRRVRHARLPLDRATLVLWPKLLAEWTRSDKPQETCPLNRDSVAVRAKDTWYTQIDFRMAESARAQARTEADEELSTVCARAAMVALPEKFRGAPPSRVFDFPADRSRNWQDLAKRVKDAEAESGVANRLEISDEEMKKYALPMPWGLYDVKNKRSGGAGVIRPDDVEGPGYHWYKLGDFPIKTSYYLYFFWSWVIQVDLEEAVDDAHPDRLFEIWARIKFEGSGFPHGKSGDKNAIYVERVIVVKKL